MTTHPEAGAPPTGYPQHPAAAHLLQPPTRRGARHPSGLFLPGELDEQGPQGLTSDEHFEARVQGILGELLDTDGLDKMPTLEPLLGDLLYVNTLCRVVGPSGHFKSFVVIDFAGHIGTGTPWHGRYVRQGTVVYLVAEGAEGIRKRVRAWEQHHGLRMTDVYFLPRPVQVADPEWDVLTAALARVRPVLIVVDTQARVTVGVEENSNTEMGRIVDRLERLRAATGACVQVIHHTGHQGEHGRGASAVKGTLQTELLVSKKGDRAANIIVTIKTGKQKDEEQETALDFGLKVVKIDGEAKPDGRPVTSVVLVPLDSPDAGPRPPAEGSPEWIVQQLDAAGVPNDWGRERVSRRLADLGLKARKDKIEEAIRVRKARAENLPPDLPPASLDDAAPPSGAGQDIAPGQTCPGQVGGRSGQASSDLPAPSSSLGRGQVGPQTPTCDGCGDPLAPHYAAEGNTRHVLCQPSETP